MKSILTFFLALAFIDGVAQETLQSVTDRGNRTTSGLELNIPALNPNKYLFLGGGVGYARIGAYDPTIGFDNLIIDAAKIGMGTSSPIGKLDVRGAAFIGTNDLVLGSAGSFIQIDQGNDWGNTYTQLRAYSNGGTSFNNLVLQNGAGSVGIGTTTPSTKLEVTTNTDYDQLSLTKNTVEYYKGAGILFRNLVDDGSTAEIGGVQARLLNGSTGNVAGSLSFYTKSNSAKVEAVTINPEGDMGIGTANPKEKLSVNGKIRAKEIKVEATNWPDYVFEEGYKMGTLGELERYIKANKHLPDMPAAREIAANGLELGEVVRLQQQKIEELTLHLIDKDKALKKVEVENTKLRAKQAEQDTAIKKMIDRIDKLELNKP